MILFSCWLIFVSAVVVLLQTAYLPTFVSADYNTNTSICSEKIDLAFILDCSGSVSTSNYLKMKQFLKDLTDHFVVSQDQTRVSVMWFSNNAAIDIPFSRNFKSKQDLHSAVDNVPYHGGGTNTAGALNLAYTTMFTVGYGARQLGAKKLLIILTDGFSSGNVDAPAQQLKRNGVIIYSVGIGSGINFDELRTMASFPTSQRVILLQNFHELSGLARNMSSSTCTAAFYQVTCDKDAITVAFPRSNLPRSVNVSNLYLGGGLCKANYNSTHVFVRTLLDDCGTTYDESEQEMYFSNSLTSVATYSPGAVITREQLFDFQFTCAYDRLRTVGTFQFQPARQKLTVKRRSAGNFTFSLDFFRDSTYYSTYSDTDYPVFKSLSDRIYVQYSVNTSNTDIVIRAVHCRATPTNKPYDVPQYDFIFEGCDRDSTINHHTFGLRQMHRFSMQAFAFLTEHRFVYLHCDLLLCNRKIFNSTCTRSTVCPNRRRRDVSSADQSDRRYQLSFGPLMHNKNTIKNTKKPAKPPADSNPNTILIGSLVGAVVLAVLLASVLLIQRKRRRPRSPQSSSQPEVLAIDNMAASKE